MRTSCVFPKVRVCPRHLARAYRGGIIHHEAFEQAIVSFLSFSSFERARSTVLVRAHFFPLPDRARALLQSECSPALPSPLSRL